MAKSEYLQREEAAKKQLGAKGVAKRVKQVPRAARLSVKELTGVNISRKGVTVDPGAAALAAAGFIPFGKSLSVAAKASKPVVSRWANAATAFSRAKKAKIAPPDASKMIPAPRPMLPARRGTPPDASKMLPPRKPKPSTKALRDYRSTGRPSYRPGSMEGWQGIQNVRRGNR